MAHAPFGAGDGGRRAAIQSDPQQSEIAITFGGENNVLSVRSPGDSGNLPAIEGQLFRFAAVERLHIKIAGTSTARSPSHERQTIASWRKGDVAIPFIASIRLGQPPLLPAFHIDQ